MIISELSMLSVPIEVGSPGGMSSSVVYVELYIFFGGLLFVSAFLLRSLDKKRTICIYGWR